MRMRREPPIQIKTPAQLRADARGRPGGRRGAGRGRVAAAARDQHRRAGRDRRAARSPAPARRRRSFKGYHGYPATICISVNDEIVHGIPAADRLLAAGDVVSIDCGAIVARLARRRGPHDRRRPGSPGRRRRADRGLRGGHVAGPGRGPGRRTADRHLARGRDQRAGRRAVRHRGASTPGTASAPRCTWTRPCPTRPARPRPAAGRGHGAGHRADADVLAGPTPGCWTTAGRWSRRTAASPRTSSTPSRSPRTGRGC